MTRHKSIIEQSFSRAAETYDRYAEVQMQASHLLLSTIWEGDFASILEIGCGTGNYTQMLLNTYKKAGITSVDLSRPMILKAMERLGTGNRVKFVQADGEKLPSCIQGPFDLITSSGTMQWFKDFKKALRSLTKILHTDGTICFTTFGPGTLHQLQDTINVYPETSRPLPAASFLGQEDIADLLKDNFNSVQSRGHRITMEYPDLYSLLKTLRATGTSPQNRRGPTITGPARLKRLEKIYIHHYGAITATYEILIFKAWSKRKS